MEEKIITFLNLEWNRMIRTLTPPIPSDNQIQEEVKKAIASENWYLQNQND